MQSLKTSTNLSLYQRLLKTLSDGLSEQAPELAADKVKFITLFDKQQEIADHPARFKVLCCGRRFSKTTLTTYILAKHMLEGERTAYFAPTYKMTKEVWRELKRLVAPVTRYKNESEQRIELTTGGSIDFWSLDKALTIRGRKYHLVALDEVSLVTNPDVWDDDIRPTLTDYVGKALFCFTPKGFNLAYKLYQWGMDETKPDWHSWQYPTSANPYISPTELAEIEQSTPKRTFEQEYLAKFIEDAGGVFRGVAGVSTLPAQSPTPNGQYIFGVDWGKDNDFTVISVIDAKTKRQVYMERFREIGWSLQRGRLMHLYKQWKPSIVIAENNSIGSVNIEALQNEGLPVQPFQTTAQSKSPLIEGLALAIERGDIALLNDPTQILELQSYQMERLTGGGWRYSAPAGGHDDTVIALALAWHGAQSRLSRISAMVVN